MTNNSKPQGLPCPLCSVDLVMSERQGISIDYCPLCRGVWLDRGELDKIVERSIADEAARQTGDTWSSQAQRGHAPARHGDSHGGHHGRRKSFLRDLFD